MAWRERVLAVLAAWLLAGAAHALDLDPAGHDVALWPAIRTLADPGGTLTPADVAARIDAGEGEPMRRNNQGFGKWLPHPYWAEFSIRNTESASAIWFLTYEVPNQDETSLWRADGAASGPPSWQPVAQLESQADPDKPFGLAYPVWRVRLAPGEAARFVVRIDGYNLMRFPIHAVREHSLLRTVSILQFWLGFALAIPCVVVLYVLTLARTSADRSLPLFLAMAGCEMLGALWLSGLLHELFPDIDRWRAGWIGWAGYIGMLGLSCLHAQVFLRTAARDKIAHGLLTFGAWLWLVVVPLAALSWPISARLVLVVGGTLHAFAMLWLVARHVARSASTPRLLLLGVWIVYACSALIYVLYRTIDLSVYVLLASTFAQGSLVAALLGCAVSAQIVGRKRALEQEARSAHDRNLLYAAAHHDLWQPLQSVELFAQGLRDAHAPQRDALIDGIEASVGAVREFMATMRIVLDTESARVRTTLVRPDEMLQPVIDEYRHWATLKPAMLRYVSSRCWVRTDAALMQRIARNLLSNALRYTEEGGRIVVGWRRREGRLWLVVADDGVGMSELSVARAFRPFARFGDVERAPAGLGLGLYSVKRIADLIGADVRLESRLCAGTRVWVSVQQVPV